MKNKRILAFLLAFAMLLCLCACGGDAQGEKSKRYDFGDYEVAFKSACIMPNDEGEDSLVVYFDFTNNSDSAASYGWTVFEKLTQEGAELESTFVIIDLETYDYIGETAFSDIEPGVTAEVSRAYKLNGTGKVAMNISDLYDKYSYNLTFDPASLERVEPKSETGEEAPDAGSQTTVSSEDVPEDSFLSWWSGDWYGWWGITAASGAYEEIDGAWWDACAVLDVGEPAEDSEYNAALTMWDEDGSRTDTLIGEAEVTLSPYGVGEHGTMYSESGYFMDHVLEHADWIIDPALEDVENLISIEGEYSGEEGSYSYIVILRPWGTLWEDMDESGLPYAYESWYLPLINSGASMPDSLSQGVSENDLPVAGDDSGEEAGGNTQGFGDFASILVPEEFEFQRDSWNEENPHFVSVKRSDFAYFDFHNFTEEAELMKEYEYVKKTYTNEQEDVSANYGGIDWTGFQYSDGFGGYGFEVYTVIGDNYLRVTGVGFAFDHETSAAVLGSVVMAQ